MKLTVKYLTQQPYMNHVRILCAEHRLCNPVEGIGLLEDVTDNLTILKNTLVLADGISIDKLSEIEMDRLLNAYRNIKVSAICLKACANQNGLDAFARIAGVHNIPVLLLPEDIIFSSVISGINYEILYANGYNFAYPYEENFFQEMIFTEQDPKMMHKRARMMGIRVDEFLCAILIRPSPNIVLSKFIQQCKDAWGGSSFATSKNGSVMLIGRLTVQYSLANKTFCEMAEGMAAKLKRKYPNIKLAVGVGHCFESVLNLRKSYYSAKTALIAAASNTFQKDIVYYDQLGIYKVLFDIKNRESIALIRSDTAERIRTYDNKHKTDLYNTISVYLDSFCSVQETAKKMIVHYNTIRYRINKIKEAFGWDLFCMEDCIHLAIGFRIDKFLIDEELFGY